MIVRRESVMSEVWLVRTFTVVQLEVFYVKTCTVSGRVFKSCRGVTISCFRYEESNLKLQGTK